MTVMTNNFPAKEGRDKEIVWIKFHITLTTDYFMIPSSTFQDTTLKNLNQGLILSDAMRIRFHGMPKKWDKVQNEETSPIPLRVTTMRNPCLGISTEVTFVSNYIPKEVNVAIWNKRITKSDAPFSRINHFILHKIP